MSKILIVIDQRDNCRIVGAYQHLTPHEHEVFEREGLEIHEVILQEKL